MLAEYPLENISYEAVIDNISRLKYDGFVNVVWGAG